MKEKKPINVYWSPIIINELDDNDWSFLYQNPYQLFSSLVKNKSNEAARDSFLSCPALSNKFKKTIVFNFPIDSEYIYDFTEDNKMLDLNKENSIIATNSRDRSLNDGPFICLSMSYIYFSEEPLDAFFSPPYFHKSQYTQYGSPVPGEFNIGKWFRPYNLDIQMWANKGELVIKQDEPLFYTEFKTDRPIILKRFNMNRQLLKYSSACVDTVRMFGRGKTLLERYGMFDKVGLREKILTEIKKNIIEDSAIRL